MAYTYTGTPSERILQAKNRVTNESVNGTLSNYLKVNTGEQEQAIENGVKNASVGEKIGDTLGDIFKNIASGVEKAFEGIADFGASTVGVIAGWAGNDTLKDEMSNFVARDLVTEGWQYLASKGYDVDFANSAINDLSETGQNIVRGVSQGVGQMLPMVITTALTGGTSLATLGNVANWGGFAMSAAGTGTESALNDVDSNGNPVSLDRAYLYGLAEGAKELATEMIVGGAFWDKGAGVLDKAIGNLSKSAKFSKLVSLGLNSLGEGFEEVVGEVFENTLQTIYKDDNFHWESPDAASVIENGIIGSLTAAVLGGGQSAMVKASNTMTIQEEMANLKENEDYVQRMQDKGNYDEKVESRYTQEKERATNEISKRLKKMTDEKREKAFAKSPQLATLFDAKGNIKSTQLNEGVTAIENRSQAIQNGTLDARITDTNKVANVLRNASVSIESGQDAKFKLSESLNETESKNLETFKKLNQLVGKDTGINTKFAVYEQQEKITNKEGNNVTGNAFINGDVVYINKSRLQNENDVYKAFAHEVIGHFTENTNEHNALVKVASEILGEERVSQIEKSIKENYKEDAIESEIDAHIVEEFLSEKGTKYIEELATKNESLAKKFKAKVDKVIKYIESVFKGDKEALQELKSLRKMSKLIEDTLAKGGMKYGVENAVSNLGLEVVDGKIQFSTKAVRADIERYRDMLEKSAGKQYAINVINLLDSVCNEIDIRIRDFLNNTNVSEEEKKQSFIDSIDYGHNVTDEQIKTDDRQFKPVKKNSDKLYQVSLDFSTLCKKRLLQQAIEVKLTQMLNKNISRNESIQIRHELEKLRDEGEMLDIQVACGLCYVESARAKGAAIIKRFLDAKERKVYLTEFFNGEIDEVKELVKDAEIKKRKELGIWIDNSKEQPALKDLTKYQKEEIRKAKKTILKNEGYLTEDDTKEIEYALSLNAEDFISPVKLTELKKNHPKVYQTFKLCVSSATKSKAIEQDVYYRAGDTANTISDELIRKMNAENGLRSQSWSDFQVSHLLDYIGAIIELSARKSKLQTYTKVEDFVKLMGKTNAMINLSLIPMSKYNGKLEFSSLEGMDLNTALKLRKEYPDIAGTICIGISDEHIKQLLADDRIDYVIPYHSSGMPKSLYKHYQIEDWNSYQSFQEEKGDGEKTKFSDWFKEERVRELEKEGLTGIKIMQALAEDYKNLCKERGITKKFPQFENEENYWKLLIDRKMVNQITNKVIIQKAVEPTFDIKAIKKILDEHTKDFTRKYNDEQKATKHIVDQFKDGKLGDRDTKKLVKSKVDEFETNSLAFASQFAMDYKVDDGVTYFSKDSGTQFSIGININDSTQSFTEQILNGEKTIETRNSRTLDAYIGERVGIVRTGKGKAVVVGSCVIGEPIVYDSKKSFDADYKKHLVGKDSIYYINNIKYGYLLLDVQSYPETPVDSLGIVSRKLNESVSFSKSVDSEGNQLSVEQEEFFKDSKIRKDGYLIPVYHSTKIGGFTKFYGKNFYFTDNQKVAKTYGNSMYEVYLNINNPAKVDVNNNVWSKIAVDDIKIDGVVDVKKFLKDNGADFFKEGGKQRTSVSDIVYAIKHSNTGYDGVVINNVDDRNAYYDNNDLDYIGNDYIAFYPNQIKNIDNYNPTTDNDIRFSKNVELTEAVKKSVDEIFNKETAEMGIVTDNDIHDIVNNAIKLAADTPRPYAELVCQEIADNIINKAHIVSVYYTQEDVEELKKEKQILDGYKHKFKFSERDREEIKYTFDKDAKTIYLMWSAKNGGVETDIFYSELEGKTGFITESLTGIDQFKDFLDYYNKISNKIKSAQEIDGTDIKSAKWDNEILYDIRDKIRDDLIEAVLPYVDKSKKEQSIARNKELEKSYKVATETIEKLKKDLDRAKTRVEKYNQRANEAYERNKTTNKIIDIAKKFSKEELKKYPNASMLGDAQFNLALSAIAKLVHRGDLGKVGARKAIDKINEWYTDKNTFLQASDEQCGTLFNAEIKDAMESIVENTKAHPNRAFTNEELKNVLRIVQHIQHLMKTYDEFTKAGKKASVKKTATEGIDVARQMSKFSNTNKLFAMIKKFGEWIVEPRVFIRQLFGYQSNPISEIYEDIVDGETRASKVRMDILQPLSEFYKEHKNYKKSLSEKVTFMGKSITKAELISLYKYEKQEHSRGALHSTGFGMINEKTRMFEEYGVLDDSSVSEMNSLLNETDKAYIQAVEESMKIGAKYQIETDYDYKGFTFIDEDATEFYLPIKRWSGDFAKSMQETYMDAIRVDAAGNQSISKQRTNNVRRIQVRPIDSIVENYAKQCGTYAGLAVPIKNFERVLNFNIGSVNKPISIRNILNEQVSADAMPYLANLLNDIQGISDKSSQVTIFGKIRGNYAKFQLGANLKVIMSQMASYPTAFTELRASSMTKAFTHKIDFKDMDKYSDWAKARNYFDDVVRSEGILENVDKFTDLFTKPIQWTDRLTIAAIWNACQVEIETNHKGDSTYKYGTEENKKEAAKLLEHIGRTTQPNYTTTERTQLQRSKNEFMKTLAMFTAVPSKQVSRLIEAVGQTRAYVWKKKNGLKVTEQEAKQVKVYLAKTISAISLANIVYVMMGELVKFLFNKDREKDGEEISLGEDIGWDFLSTTIGMFPIVKNIYSYFVDGYDLDSGSYLTGGLEDILSSTKDIIELTSSVVSGNNVDSSEWYKALKSYSYGLGQVTGLPTRNIYNMVYGLTKRFDTSSAYKISSLFTSSTQYTKDLNQALKDGDENLATTIVGLIMEDDSMTSTSKAVNEKIKDLYSKGYSVLPKSVKDSVSYDGETYSLNANQQKVIKSMYQEANSDIESLIKSASFTSLDEAIQSRTIKWLYDYYYEYGVSETLGLTANSKKLLFGEMMDIKKFAMAVSSCQNLQADKDSDGNTINGSKKTKVESLLRKLTLTQGEREIIKAYLGYTADENVLKRYAKSVGLTKKQQEIFLKYC